MFMLCVNVSYSITCKSTKGTTKIKFSLFWSVNLHPPLFSEHDRPPYNTSSENEMLNVNHVLSQPSRGNKEENLILANSMQRLSARLRHCMNSQERWQIQQLMNNPNQNPRKGRTFLIHLKFRTSKGKENFIKLCNDNTPNENNE